MPFFCLFVYTKFASYESDKREWISPNGNSVKLVKYPTNDDLKSAFDFTHEMGGVVVVNHIPWSYWVGMDDTENYWLEKNSTLLSR